MKQYLIKSENRRKTQRFDAFFQMFEGIDVLVIKQNEHIQRTIVNLNEIHSKIINILGIEVKNVYFPDS